MGISIHALREEGDHGHFSQSLLQCLFLSTPSARRATISTIRSLQTWVFLSTPSARRATVGGAGRKPSKDISIHALREEGDLAKFDEKTGLFEFLSTPSARRATFIILTSLAESSDFYPRPPRGGRPSAAGQHAEPDRFLSTPSARRATPRPQKWPWYKKFLSTPSARRATPNLQHLSIGFFEFLSTPSARRATV